MKVKVSEFAFTLRNPSKVINLQNWNKIKTKKSFNRRNANEIWKKEMDFKVLLDLWKFNKKYNLADISQWPKEKKKETKEKTQFLDYLTEIETLEYY